MGLRDIGGALPPGFRFYPSDEELVCHYLSRKIANNGDELTSLVDIDLHTCEPWHLPDVAKLNSNEWYFFSFRDRKYATGFRTNRATTSGYWKATGKDRVVVDPISRAVVGMRKTLVFYKNRAPNGIKTGWIMHEFRLENPHLPPKEDWVLCRVFYKWRGDKYYSPQNEYNAIISDTSPNLLSAAVSHTTQHSAHHNNITSSSSSHYPAQNPSPTHDQDMINAGPHSSTSYNRSVETKCEDAYDFLFDYSITGLPSDMFEI